MSVEGPGRGWTRWMTTVAVCAATVVVALVSCALVPGDDGRSIDSPATPPNGGTSQRTPQGTGCTVSEILVPSCGVWFGAAANPLGDESWDAALPAFEDVVGQPMHIAHYYNASPKLFPAADMIQRAREPGRKRILLLNWKPEMGHTWAEVAAGVAEVDAAIDAEAEYLKSTFPEKFFLAIHHEPEEEVKPHNGSGYTAKDYAAMYRHVALRLRSRGVTNAVFVMNYMGTPHWGSQPWFADLYPGDDVVDWIAEDPYVFGTDPEWAGGGLGGALNRTQRKYPKWPGFYSWATTAHPGKPIMLAEWGVDRKLGEATRKSVFGTMASQLGSYPQVKALVYWNETKRDTVGETRIDADDEAAAVLRTALRSAQLKPPAVPN